MVSLDGTPQRAIVASAATYEDHRWSIREGREIPFAETTLEAESMRPITGIRPELYLDPESSIADSRVENLGDAMLFCQKSTRPEYAKASIFTLNDHTQVLTYIFARAAIMSSEKEGERLGLREISAVLSWPDSRVPKAFTATRLAFP